jgi:predicted nucleic acid-binding protein
METIIITDASVLINIVASRVPDEILSGVGLKFVVCPDVLKEVKLLRDRETGEEHLIDLSAYFENGQLDLIELVSDEEFELLVDYASLMGSGDGEAMCFALAESRGLCVAIDDGRAIRRALRKCPDFKTIGTLDVLAMWQKENSISPEAMNAVLIAIERFARYRPSVSHPRYEWWKNYRDLTVGD